MNSSGENSGVTEATGNEGANDLVKAVDQLLDNLGPKFSKVSAELFSKMDDMAQRLDDMETAIKAGSDTGMKEISDGVIMRKEDRR